MQHFIFGLPAYMGYDKSWDLNVTWVAILVLTVVCFVGFQIFKGSPIWQKVLRFDQFDQELIWLDLTRPSWLRALFFGVSGGIASFIWVGIGFSFARFPVEVIQSALVLSFFVGFVVGFYWGRRIVRPPFLRFALIFIQISIAALVLKGVFLSPGALGVQWLYVGLFLIVVADIVWRIFRNWKSETIDARSISILPWIFLFRIFFIPSLDGLVISTDDYHWGEYLLSGERFFSGSIPYADFLPAHGLMNIFPSIFSRVLFGDLLAEHVFYGYLLLHYGILIISGLIFSLFIPWPIVLPLMTVLNWGRPIYGVLAGLLVWMILRLKRGDLLPAFILGVFGPLLVFFELGVGVSFGISSALVIGVFFSQKFWRERAIRSPLVWGSVILFLVQMLWFLKIGLLQGAVRSLLENSKVNLAAYGVPWATTFVASLSEKFGLNFFRMTWIFFVASFLAFALKLLWERKKASVAPAFLWLSLAVPGLLLMGYAMGRVDPGMWSRAGGLSGFYLAISVSLVLTPYFVRWKWLSGAIFVFALMPVLERPKEFAMFLATTNWDLHSEQKTTVDHFGPQHLRSIDEIHGHLTSVCGERPKCFYDLTNRNALYSYLGAKTDLRITAYYNTAHPDQEARTMELLRQSPPDFILLAKDEIRHDGGSPALRVPRLWQELIRDPSLQLEKWEDGVVALVRSSEAYGGGKILPVDEWFPYVATSDLGFAPDVWGKSSPTWLMSLNTADLDIESFGNQKARVIVPQKGSHLLLQVRGCSAEESQWRAYPENQPEQIVSWMKRANGRQMVLPLGNWPQFARQPGLSLMIESDCEMSLSGQALKDGF